MNKKKIKIIIFIVVIITIKKIKQIVFAHKKNEQNNINLKKI